MSVLSVPTKGIFVKNKSISEEREVISQFKKALNNDNAPLPEQTTLTELGDDPTEPDIKACEILPLIKPFEEIKAFGLEKPLLDVNTVGTNSAPDSLEELTDEQKLKKPEELEAFLKNPSEEDNTPFVLQETNPELFTTSKLIVLKNPEKKIL